MKKKIIITVSIVLLILLVSIIFSYTRNITKMSLRTNSKPEFSISDLKVNDISYNDSESKCKKEFGEPNKITEKSENNISYKTYIYDDLELTFELKYSTYSLVKATIKSNKYTDGRKIKIGNSAKKVLKSYYVQNKKGNVMYGNYSSSELDNDYILSEVKYGERTKNTIKYGYKDKYATYNEQEMPRNIMKIDYILKNNRVTEIIWSYGNF